MMIANAKECVKPPTYEQIPKVNYALSLKLYNFSINMMKNDGV